MPNGFSWTDLSGQSFGIGMPVEMVPHKIREDGLPPSMLVAGGERKGMIVYGYKFRPVMQVQ